MIFWTVFVHALVESFEFRVLQFCIKFGSLVQVANQCELFAEFSFVVSTTDIVTTQVCQFQKDNDEQARCKFNTGISMCQSQKDRDEQAWYKFEFVVSMKVCQFQKDRDEQAQCGFLFSQSSEMSTADILAMKVRQFQKDRDEQEPEMYQSQTLCGRSRSLTAIQFLTILTNVGARGFLQQCSVSPSPNSFIILYSRGRELGKLRILDHGYGDVGLVQWVREKVDDGTARGHPVTTRKQNWRAAKPA